MLDLKEKDESWLYLLIQEGEIGGGYELEFHGWIHVLLSHRRFLFEDVPYSSVKLPGATLDGLAAEKLLFSPVAVKRTRAHPMRRTGHQKELTSNVAFSRPCIHNVSALCGF